MSNLEQIAAKAWELHQKGALAQAEPLYREVLANDATQVEVWHRLGVLLFQSGRSADAVPALEEAARLAPGNPTVLNHLGAAYGAAGRLSQAEASFRQALTLGEHEPQIHFNLAVLLGRLDRNGEAEASYRKAVQLQPSYAEAWYNLANLIKDGRPLEAIAHFEEALRRQPRYPKALVNLAALLRSQNRLDEAAARYRALIELQPRHVEAHQRLGAILQTQGDGLAAYASLQAALQLKPDHPDALLNMGCFHWGRDDLAQAADCFRRAITSKPDFLEAHLNLGSLLQLQGELDEAERCYRRVLELKPDYLPAICALVDVLQHACRWADLEGLAQRLVDSLNDDDASHASEPVVPFFFLTLPVITSAEQQLRCARRWANRQFKSDGETSHRSAVQPRTSSKPKITVGYLSSDLHAHATALLIVDLFEKHDRDRFAIYGYSYGQDDGSPLRGRLVRAFDRFVDIKDASYAEAARCIRADEVDILVDLKGYTKDARPQILALRPAPIQVNYLGYPGTMGAAFMDYILVDDFIVPPELAPNFSEALATLPGCYQVNSRREASPRTPSRAECGLPADGLVFCSFNNNYKITPQVFAVWMRLLQATPQSVLWLFEGNRSAPENLRREAEAHGVAAARLVFAPRVPIPEHYARLHLADLLLDTFPVNAHTTASDSLWAGCPMLTLAGKTMISRVAGSLQRTLGLSELVTGSLEEYEARALELARDRRRLAELRARLAKNIDASRLFDAERFARAIEAAYAKMWDIHASGDSPRAFSVGEP